MEKLDNYSVEVNSTIHKIDFGTDEKGFSQLVKIVITKAQEYLESNKSYELEVADLMKKLTDKEPIEKIIKYSKLGKEEILKVKIWKS